jgi:electron transfer flavoprotein alpha subunit
LRIAVLAKQVPVAESLALGADGRLVRQGADLEMNPYCRRAVAKGTELARESDGTCTVFTLGPPAAEDVLREAVAWGADEGVHLTDPAFAGSDTLATARALAAALRRDPPYDLVLVGRNSIDGDTGQVGPELAQLLGLPFACGVRELEVTGRSLRLALELDDGHEEVEVALPAVLSVAERLCDPCKVDPEGRKAVPAGLLRTVRAEELGEGPWGEQASPTKVGAVRVMTHSRDRRVLTGDVAGQVAEAVRLLEARGALTPGQRPSEADVAAEDLAEEAVRSRSSGLAVEVDGPGQPLVAVVIEPDRPQVAAELLGTAGRLANEVGGRVVALRPTGGVDEDMSAGEGEARPEGGQGADTRLDEELGALGADLVVELVGDPVAEDVAAAVIAWAGEHPCWAVLAPSTAFGREVAGRAAAALGAGLVGDAVAVDVVDGRLVAAKPAFSGALVADISCTSAVQMVTFRPGVLTVPLPRRTRAEVSRFAMPARGRVRVLSRRRDDDVEVLARSDVVIGVGTGVRPDEYSVLSPLAAMLGAELAATRKVTDKGWAPRARQVGITGRSIGPRLYVALGLSGKFNHMVGVRAAGTVLAVNADPEAPVFSHADVGLVADWRDVVPLLERALRRRSGATAPDGPLAGGPAG